MTNDPVRLVAVDEQRGGETAEILKRLQEHTLVLLAGLGRAPTSLRIRAGEVELALEWPQQAATTVAAPGAGAVPDGAAVPALQPVAAGVAGTAGGGGHHITAHTVGVFHHAPSPGAEPFVKVGDTVRPGQQVGIIEAMKLMIAVEADTAGRITEVLVPNATPVEYGEKLFAFEPA